MDSSNSALVSEFQQIFGDGGRVRIVRSPGRVNLIGEHTDYNDGFVLPMAIEPQVTIACRGREDGIIRLASSFYPGQVVEWSIDQKIARDEPKWANYARGVSAELKAAGIPLTGMDALMTNSLPVGGGLSSSAAFEVGIGTALLTLGGLDMDLQRLALICQKAEHEYALMPCGIMDQTIVAMGRVGHAMLLDCRDLSRQYVPLDPNDLRVVVVNSMVRHELSDGEYAIRRKQCEEGVKYFKTVNPAIKALRDVTTKQIEQANGKLDEVVYRRCRHVVSENHRTTEAAKLLGRQEYEQVGRLMVQSHNSLRDDYQVSVVELDFLVEEAMKTKGVYGARMTGGGFGGSIVALTQPRAAQTVIEALKKPYKAKFGKEPMGFVTTATAGAQVLE